eukprot:gene1577-12073_t
MLRGWARRSRRVQEVPLAQPVDPSRLASVTHGFALGSSVKNRGNCARPLP